MNRILVPVDFSEESVFASRIALQIANLLNVKLRFMHVRTGKKFHKKFTEGNDDFIVSDKDVTFMEKLYNELKEKYHVEGGEIDYKIREGNVVREITNQAHYDDSGLIVIGTHGVSGVEDRWLGSNAYRLVANAPCPVLAVRKNMEFKKDQKIILPIDTEKVSRRIVPKVADFARKIDAEVLVTGVLKKSRWSFPGRVAAYVNQVDTYLKKNSIKGHETSQIDVSDGSQKLLDFAHEKSVTIIALPVKNQANPFENIFHPFANELINLSDLPILVVPEKE
ncbi:universal stress protein [Marinilabiliaceae bacterium ANBcel2]|nr:universal stress protein [Marinilabiliaceae bacterium ANBcel2]